MQPNNYFKIKLNEKLNKLKTNKKIANFKENLLKIANFFEN